MPEKTEPQPQAKFIEEKALDAEDLKLQQEVYGALDRCGSYLRDKFAVNKKDARTENDIKDFKRSPYQWMVVDLSKRIDMGNQELEKRTGDQIHRLKIKQSIIENKQTLNRLKLAMAKNLPLKLNRDFEPNKIKLDNGELFDIENNTEDINKEINLKNTKYEITGVVQRKDADFVVLKTDEGKQIEVDTSVLYKILEHKKNIPKQPEPIAEVAEVVKEGPTQEQIEKFKILKVERDQLKNEIKEMKVSQKALKVEIDEAIKSNENVEELNIPIPPYKKGEPEDISQPIELNIEPSERPVLEDMVAEHIPEVIEETQEPLDHKTQEVSEPGRLIETADNTIPETVDLGTDNVVEKIEQPPAEPTKNEAGEILHESRYSGSNLRNEMNAIVAENNIKIKNPVFEFGQKGFRIEGKVNGQNISMAFVDSGEGLEPMDRINIESENIISRVSGVFTKNNAMKKAGEILSELIPFIKKHFEEKLGKEIKSMNIDRGQLVLSFNEK